MEGRKDGWTKCEFDDGVSQLANEWVSLWAYQCVGGSVGGCLGNLNNGLVGKGVDG